MTTRGTSARISAINHNPLDRAARNFRAEIPDPKGCRRGSGGITRSVQRTMTNHGKSLTRGATSANGTERPPTDWNSINWRKANGIVRRLRQRIYVATQKGEWNKVRSLQKLMLRSRSNVVISVRRVAQVNTGSRTPGVDKLTLKTPKARGMMVDRLIANTPWKVRPVKRVYIPKANGKRRPLGIPVIQDRALQAMVKNSLEPSWESQFEIPSYGFRPGRSQHDAVEKIFLLARTNKLKKWVVDADIKGAFDNISHDHLLKTIGDVPGKELILQWLKAGYVEHKVWSPTEAGTPQGGVISPLLSNIALHGMEDALAVRKTLKNGKTVVTHDGVCYRSRGTNVGRRAFVRYADDFVVFCETEEDAHKVIETLKTWLADRGLQLSDEKTRVVHMTEGFDFLGFNFRHYKSSRTKTGWKLLIEPSKKNRLEIRQRLRNEWKSCVGNNVRWILPRLNPIIRGWANYFRVGNSYKTFAALDHFMWRRQACWANRTHPQKNTKWKRRQYWGKMNFMRRDRYVFGDKHTGAYMTKFAWVPIERHTLVVGRHSPDDPALKWYWRDRQLSHCKDMRLSDRKIVVRQKGRCPQCGESLFNGEDTGLFNGNGEELHRHHLKPRAKGGESTYRNLRYMHLFCHQQAHSKTNPIRTKRQSNEEMTAEVRENLRMMLALGAE